jgi:site-specific recombinase
MVATAAGGGAVLAFTTWAKFAIVGLATVGLLGRHRSFGLNYATSFVIVMLLHWTVATKQPAVTAPAMAAQAARHERAAVQCGNFVDEVAHLLRSQFAVHHRQPGGW